MESQNYSETTTQYTTILYLKPEQKEEEKAIKAEKKKLKPNKQVVWAEDTIDNENMNRLKSKSKKYKMIIPIFHSLLYLPQAQKHRRS